MDELQFNTGEQKIFKRTSIKRLASWITSTSTIPVVSSSLELFIGLSTSNRYGKEEPAYFYNNRYLHNESTEIQSPNNISLDLR
ncbi:hypothetical protein H8356DRAFT_1332812 [Neocallimastix lanati (nom. inval.)]|nr:hypothetical protein H8356DRAFT_1332812 [Neocallimastix sp. JGI-2020a]